jgi:hypothetical protein
VWRDVSRECFGPEPVDRERQVGAVLLDGAERQQDDHILAAGETLNIFRRALGKREHGDLPRENTPPPSP